MTPDDRWALFTAVAATLLVLLLALHNAGWTTERSASVVREFRRSHPCPATNETTGSCPGWVVDHLRPLCFGGADAPENMAWQRYEDSLKKDAFERDACALLRTVTEQCPSEVH